MMSKSPPYLLLVLAMSIVSGCNKNVNVADKTRVTIGYSAPTLADEGQVAIQQGAASAARNAGWEFTTTDAERDAANQLNQIDSLIARGVAALVIVPVDSAALTVAVEKANRHNIPVITIDRKTSGGKLLLTVQSDNYMAGKQAAVRMVQLLKQKYGSPKGLVLELQGSLGTDVAQLRGSGFNEVLKQYSEIKVISKPTDWDPDKGAMTVADILTVHPELDGIYWHSDAIGAGVVPALERLHRLKPTGDREHIILVGIDGMRFMLTYIREKKVDATMSQNLLDLGQVALRILGEHFKGTPVPTSGAVEQRGASWSPANVRVVDTGPLINLATTPVDVSNVDDPLLWGNRERGKSQQ